MRVSASLLETSERQVVNAHYVAGCICLIQSRFSRAVFEACASFRCCVIVGKVAPQREAPLWSQTPRRHLDTIIQPRPAFLFLTRSPAALRYEIILQSLSVQTLLEIIQQHNHDPHLHTATRPPTKRAIPSQSSTLCLQIRPKVWFRR